MQKASTVTDDVSKRLPALFAGAPMTGRWTSSKTKAQTIISRSNWKSALSKIDLGSTKISLKHKKNIIAGLVVVNVALIGATAHQEYPGRVQQAQAVEAMVTVRPTNRAVTIQPIKAPEGTVAEVTAEVVEPTPTPTPTPAPTVAGVSTARFSGNVGAMLRQATTAKWDAAQASAMNTLMGKESGLNPYAVNKSSGACGIPQAYPCSKLLNVIGSLDNVDGQIQWLLNYVASRYGTPSQALAFHRANGWY